MEKVNIYAYLRVSKDTSDVDNQRGVINQYLGDKVDQVKWLEDVVSGRVDWKERGLGKILEKAKKGDWLIVSELPRLGRSTLNTLEVIDEFHKKEIEIHIARDKKVLDESLEGKVFRTMAALFAEMERHYISERTKEGLKRVKESGVKLGRPVGELKKVKLDEERKKIEDLLAKKVSITAIAKIVGSTRKTLYSYLKRRGIAF